MVKFKQFTSSSITTAIFIIIFIMIGINYCSANNDTQNNYINTAYRKLPNQLGFYQHIKFISDDNIDVDEITLSGNYHATVFQQDAVNQDSAKSIAELTQQLHYLIGINGGFYTPNFKPVGLFIIHRKMLQHAAHDPLANTCIHVDEKGKLYLENKIDNCLNADYAMQTGPMLIKQGKINPQIETLSPQLLKLKSFFDPHYRTILALTQDKKLIIMVTSPATLSQISNLLINDPLAFGVKNIYTAIDLDGGVSTGMRINFENNPFDFSEIRYVKTFVFFN